MPPSARMGASRGAIRRFFPQPSAMAGSARQATMNCAAVKVMGGIAATATLVLGKESPQRTAARMPHREAARRRCADASAIPPSG